jgi:hypothetical protein
MKSFTASVLLAVLFASSAFATTTNYSCIGLYNNDGSQSAINVTPDNSKLDLSKPIPFALRDDNGDGVLLYIDDGSGHLVLWIKKKDGTVTSVEATPGYLNYNDGNGILIVCHPQK